MSDCKVVRLFDWEREARTIERRCANLADAILDLCGYAGHPLEGHAALPEGMMRAALSLASTAFNDLYGTDLDAFGQCRRH